MESRPSTPPAPSAASGGSKIVFADQLRALAALSVVFFHLCGGFWAWRDHVARLVFAPPLDDAPRWLPAVVDAFGFGPFGVSLFFLISGFVIPMSLARLPPGRFLLARLLRIYPTWLACFAIGLAAVWLSSRHWQRPFGLDVHTIAANALLTHTVTGVRTVEPVNWTLAIELKFYLAMALIAAVAPRAKAVPLVLFAAAVLVFNLWIAPLGTRAGVDLAALGAELVYLPYMMVGTLFFHHLRGAIGLRMLAGGSLVLVALALAAWTHSSQRAQVQLVSNVYVLNIGVFAAAYALRAHFRPQPVVDWLARISFPLYAVHCLAGFALLRWLAGAGVPAVPAVVLSLAVVVAAAVAVHRLVELPTMAWGRRLAPGRPESLRLAQAL
ncbi:acyltransferase family protein [Xylophilus sp.]|uniref:acyltransferase family protein n=1 Tax=Xylophilus sp. TaxID=2653893 RepID=UPI0013B98192|nr:acyltransferase [Xylophilus sp.]KAF1047951.1 MAG: hypothetical protein GAK38_01662 [Xylophilus sp.]